MILFVVSVVYVNSKGKQEYMPGEMGTMIAKVGFTMNGVSKIYAAEAITFETGLSEAVEVSVVSSSLKKEIVFHGDELIKGN